MLKNIFLNLLISTTKTIKDKKIYGTCEREREKVDLRNYMKKIEIT